MDVDLAHVVDSACDDLGVNVNFTCVPVQALEQDKKCITTYIFISGRQGWKFCPVNASIEHHLPGWINNLNIQKIMTSYAFY